MMGNVIVKSQIELVQQKLATSIQSMNRFLNNTKMDDLQKEQEWSTENYESLLSNVRRMAVFCEEGLEACQIISVTEPFRKAAAERALYRIYHQCVEEFFTPKTDLWYEDSRSAYTGRNSIKYRFTPPASFEGLVTSLESDFQTMREELQYYETDYLTKIKQSQ